MESNLLKFNVLEVPFEHVIEFFELTSFAVLQAIRDLLKHVNS